MGRLVDVEDVKELINGLDSLPWEEEVDDLVNSIPTAYDVDKVVEELENAISDTTETETGNGARWAYKGAIEIVRKGGVK